ncbi:MAG: ATP-dependent RecD-like DNA helicase [Myxococcales bacterium]|jgi:exodeoxyribonuclease V alpha subunit
MPSDRPLTVTVDDVIFRSPDGRFAVLASTPEQGEEQVTLVGDLGDVSPGETLSVRGRIQDHAVYGQRFQVESFTPVTPSTREGIKRYLGSGLVPGVGSSIAERIVARFGDHTLDVITSQSARLQEVEGIGPQRARSIAEAVKARAREAEALSYLHGLGLGPAIAGRIRERYGEDTVRQLRTDPYLVAEEVRGVGFRTADRIGQALGYGPDDPRRAAGAVLHLVGKAADDGHTFRTRKELVDDARELSVPEPRVLEAIETLAGRGMLTLDVDAVYAPPFYRAEVRASRRLRALSGPRPKPAGADRALADTLTDDLAEAQRRAVEVSFDEGLFVLTGGPGTGKTTTVRTLVQAQARCGRRVLLCAPTGRAAKRLSEATGSEGQTIHRMLEYNPATHGFNRCAESPLEADVVLVDEASMLDLMLGDRLLDAIPDGCALVLVGDVDQLPPVGAGPLLRELIDSDLCPVIRLTEVFRQAQRSAIVRAAHDILDDRLPTPTPAGQLGDGDLFLVRSNDPVQITDKLVETLERMRLAYGLDPKRDVQVLTPMRRGPLGTERLNEVIQRALNPSTEKPLAGFRRGDKVMQLRNDYERDVFNGDLGEVTLVTRNSLVVNVGGRRITYEQPALEALTLAYASTIHKVQGSEFPAVVIVLHGTHHVLLSRALIYTAITRAKRLAVVLGPQRALMRAIHNSTVQRTNCRLGTRLRR